MDFDEKLDWLVRIADGGVTEIDALLSVVAGQPPMLTIGQAGQVTSAPELRWTSELPTVDGAYWLRNPASKYQRERDGYLVDVRVEATNNPRVHYFGVSCSDVPSHVGSEWAGPLVRP